MGSDAHAEREATDRHTRDPCRLEVYGVPRRKDRRVNARAAKLARLTARRGGPIRFVSPGKAIGVNETYRIGRWGKRAGFMKSDAAHAYAARLAVDAVADNRGASPLVGPVDARISFVYADRRPDIDGAIKPTLDALQGIAYVNDRQIERLLVEKHLDAERPRVEFEARPFEHARCPYCGSDDAINAWDDSWRAAA